MGWFHFSRQQRASVRGFGKKQSVEPNPLQAFILESILTPSGLVDAPDHTPSMLDLVIHPATDLHIASSDFASLPDSNHTDTTSVHGTIEGSVSHDVSTSHHAFIFGGGYGSEHPETTDHTLTSIGYGYGASGTETPAPVTPTPKVGEEHPITATTTALTTPTTATLPITPTIQQPVVDSALIKVVGSDVTPVLVAQVSTQPLVGIIDTGFAAHNPYLDYSQVTLGHDYVDGDTNPLLQPGQGNDHGTGILGIVEATQHHSMSGLQVQDPLWLGRATGSGHWADSLREFVDQAKATGHPQAVVNLSFDLTQTNLEGSSSTRFTFTPQELGALNYAHENHVLIVAAAGNQDGAMSALGQASQQFDNIITVGAADGMQRAEYSSYGAGLDILANGGTPEHPILTAMGSGLGAVAGSSAAAAQVTGAVSLVWQANPDLSYRQVIDLLEHAATDVGTTGWDAQSGFGVLNLAAAISLARQTVPDVAGLTGSGVDPATLISIPWATTTEVSIGERPTDDWSEPLPDPAAENGVEDDTEDPAPSPDAPTQESDTPPEGEANSDESGEVPTDNLQQNESEASDGSTDDLSLPEPDEPSASNTPADAESQEGYGSPYDFGFRDGYSSFWYGGGSYSSDSFDGKTDYSKGFIAGWDAAYNDLVGWHSAPSNPPDVNPDQTGDLGNNDSSDSGDGYGGDSGSGYGSDSGNGYGVDSGNGYGVDSSYGYGYGSGSGSGHDSGSGYGSDFGDGYSDNSGDGSDSDSGSGYELDSSGYSDDSGSDRDNASDGYSVDEISSGDGGSGGGNDGKDKSLDPDDSGDLAQVPPVDPPAEPTEGGDGNDSNSGYSNDSSLSYESDTGGDELDVEYGSDTSLKDKSNFKHSDDPAEQHCIDLLQKIIDLEEQLKGRFDAMVNDPKNLYTLRRRISDPIPDSLTKEDGSYEGHQKKYNDVRGELNEALDEFYDKCDPRDPEGYLVEDQFISAQTFGRTPPPEQPKPKSFVVLPDWAVKAGASIVDGVLFVPITLGAAAILVLKLLIQGSGLTLQTY